MHTMYTEGVKLSPDSVVSIVNTISVSNSFGPGPAQRLIQSYRSLIPKIIIYSKICLKPPLTKKTKIGFQDQLPHNAGQSIGRMLQGRHSAIL